MTSFRFAYGGAQEAYGVTPDLATYDKIVGGGSARRTWIMAVASLTHSDADPGSVASAPRDSCARLREDTEARDRRGPLTAILARQAADRKRAVVAWDPGARWADRR